MLPLPDSNETQVYRLICNTLKTNETLQGVVKTWYLWDGEKLSPIDDATDRNLPFISVEPSDDTAGIFDEQSTETVLNMVIQLGVKGTDAADAFNLWDAIRRAIFPADKSLKNALNALNAFSPLLTKPGYSLSHNEQNANILTAEGIISIKMRVMTRN